MTNTRKLTVHVGVSKATDKEGGYVITAEYKDGYLILARFKTAEEAEAALPQVKRGFSR